MDMENKYSTTETSSKDITKMANLMEKEDTNGRTVAFTKDNSKEDIGMDRVYYTKVMVLFTKVIIFLRK